jgi:hypothetical protein
MDEPTRQQAFLTALVTEHFVQASARAATITESNGRAAIYLSAASSGLVAFGFLAQGAGRLDPFVAAVLPALFILGIFTFIRLVQTSIEAAVLSLQIQRIRGYYRTLVPEAQQFFDPPRHPRCPRSGHGHQRQPSLPNGDAVHRGQHNRGGQQHPRRRRTGPAGRHPHPSWVGERPRHRRRRRGAPVRAAPAVWLPTSRANGWLAATAGAPPRPSPAASPWERPRPPPLLSTPAGCKHGAAPRIGPGRTATKALTRTCERPQEVMT